MKRVYVIFFMMFLTFGCKDATSNKEVKLAEEPQGVNNIAYKWGQLALTATANDTERFKPRPTITSRYLALIFVGENYCMKNQNL